MSFRIMSLRTKRKHRAESADVLTEDESNIIASDSVEFSTIFVNKPHYHSPLSLPIIRSELQQLKDKMSTGYVFSSETIEHLSFCLHTFLLRVKDTDFCNLFDIYLNDSHCHTFRSLIKQSENGLSFVKGLVKAFQQYSSKKPLFDDTHRYKRVRPSIYPPMNDLMEVKYLHYGHSVLEFDSVLEGDVYPSPKIGFIDKLLTFFIKIHTDFPHTDCLITDHGSKVLHLLLNAVVPSLYNTVVPSFLSMANFSINGPNALIRYLKYAELIDDKLDSLLTMILDQEQCADYSEDQKQLFLTSSAFFLTKLSKLLVANNTLNIHENVYFQVLERTRSIMHEFPFVLEKQHLYKVMNFSILTDLLSIEGFDGNAKCPEGETFASFLCTWIGETTSNRYVLQLKNSSLHLGVCIFRLLGSIGAHPSTTNATITEALLKLPSYYQLSPKYCSNQPCSSSNLYEPYNNDNSRKNYAPGKVQLRKAYESAVASLICNKHFEIHSPAVTWKGNIHMTFGHFAARKQLPLDVFLKHPEFDAMIADSKGDSILHTFILQLPTKNPQSKSTSTLKCILKHSTSDVSRLNSKKESLIDISISQYIGKTITEEAYIESTRQLSTHPTASNDQIQKSLTVLVDIIIKEPAKMARLVAPITKNIAAYQSCIAEICSSGLYDINTMNKDGSTVAHLAAMAGNEVAMKIFIDTEGFDPNIQDGNGNTALFYVIENFTVGTVRSFIDTYHWDLNIKNHLSETVYEYCESLTDLSRRSRLGRMLSQIMPGHSRSLGWLLVKWT